MYYGPIEDTLEEGRYTHTFTEIYCLFAAIDSHLNPEFDPLENDLFCCYLSLALSIFGLQVCHDG